MFNVDGDTGFITAESHAGGGGLKPILWSQEETLAIGSQEQLRAGDPSLFPSPRSHTDGPWSARHACGRELRQL